MQDNKINKEEMVQMLRDNPYIRNVYFANRYSVTRSRISALRKSLVKNGLIPDIEQNPGSPSYISQVKQRHEQTVSLPASSQDTINELNAVIHKAEVILGALKTSEILNQQSYNLKQKVDSLNGGTKDEDMTEHIFLYPRSLDSQDTIKSFN